MKKDPLPSIVILFNRVTEINAAAPAATLADEDTIWTAVEAQKALTALGYKAELYEVTEENLATLGQVPGDVILNLAEGVGNILKSDFLVARQLEESGRLFTGCSSQALEFTNDKIATKDLLIAHGLPTAPYQIFLTDDISSFTLKFPVIVKPSREDSSLGITINSIATTKEDLQEKVSALCKLYPDPVLVEEYIEGRELNVTVVGYGDEAVCLPISEVMFGEWFKDKFKVVDFAAKWEENTPAYQNSWGVAPAPLDEPLRKKIEEISLTAYNLTTCEGYGRVDIRLSEDLVPYVLEVNANPGVAPDSGAVRSAKAAGYTYESFIEYIVTIALRHYDQEKTAPTTFKDTFAFS